MHEEGDEAEAGGGLVQHDRQEHDNFNVRLKHIFSKKGEQFPTPEVNQGIERYREGIYQT